MKRFLLATLLLGLFIPGLAKAQSTDGGTVALNITDLLFVSITSGSNQLLTPTISDFDNGFIDAAPLSIDTKGNTDHDLFIRADNASWTYAPDGSGNADPGKLASDLGYKLTAAVGSHTGLTTANQLVDNLGAGTNTVGVDLRVVLDYLADVEGDYSLDYTVEVIAAP